MKQDGLGVVEPTSLFRLAECAVDRPRYPVITHDFKYVTIPQLHRRLRWI